MEKEKLKYVLRESAEWPVGVTQRLLVDRESTVQFCAGKQPRPGADPLIGCPGFATDLLISYLAL